MIVVEVNKNNSKTIQHILNTFKGDAVRSTSRQIKIQIKFIHLLKTLTHYYCYLKL